MMEKVEKSLKSSKFWIVGQASSKSGDYRFMSSSFTDHVNWCTTVNDALKIHEDDTRNAMKIAKLLKTLYPDEKYNQTFAMKVKLCVDDQVFAEEIDPEILKS